MKLSKYLKPENSGKQLWQMVISNLTKGSHPYNFTGFCMALVSQWFLEVHFANGKQPDELGLYLLKEKLGNKGYEGIANSQDIYNRTESDNQMIIRHTGNTLKLGQTYTRNNSKLHWQVVRSRVYIKNNGSLIPDDETIRLDDKSRIYSGLIGISGDNNILLKPFIGKEWAHAIGLHTTKEKIYIFDPNYGVFIFDSEMQGDLSTFFKDLWSEYGVTEGTINDVVKV